MKCFHLALLLSTTLGLAAADSPHERIGKAESELGAFRETKSPAALTSAYRNARDIAEVPNRETWEAHRRKKLELLLSALKEMDHAIDPKFDPERRPMSQPPLPAGAPLELNIGVSPSSIEDPKLRAEYEQAIEDHRSYARYYNAQIQFRELRR